ncbi:MAG: PcfJ domain-containing protein [Anaerovoracaceae bacterium]|uniref:PcfJ domain-containing protein n=1 Tax=Chryseobacterium sp. TaxID=1871047 RepID=UPI002FC6F14B
MKTVKHHNIPRPAGLVNYILQNAEKNVVVTNQRNDFYFCLNKNKKIKPYYRIRRTHNEEDYIHCNGCDKKICKVKFKHEQYGMKNETEYGRILWFARRGKTTYAQLEIFEINYTKNGAEVLLVDQAKYKLNREEQLIWKKEWEYSSYSYEYRLGKKMSIPKFGATCFGLYRYETLHTYNPKCLGTDLKYANLDEIGEELTITYLSQFLEYPSIEVLQKLGYDKILKSRLNGQGCRNINWRQTELSKIFKIEKNIAKQFKDFELYELDAFLAIRKKFKDFKIENMKFIKCSGDYITKIEKCVEYMSIDSLFNYLKQQNILNVSNYYDHIIMLEELGKNMADKKLLKPKDFQKEHAELAAEKAELLDKGKAKIFKAKTALLADKYYFEYKEIIFKPVSTIKELIFEGKILNHCVGSYADKILRGDSMICFIRKKDEPDVPYFTLEISKRNEIKQCYGFGNRISGLEVPEIKEALDEYIKFLKGTKKKGKKVA